MYPTKSTYDYMNEMNRLFPRTSENDVYQTQMQAANTTFNSPFRQSTPANKSSSSADSMSPDSFPDMSYRSDNERPVYESPFVVKRQRPIVGRKIFENTERLQPVPEPKFEPQLKPFKQDLDFPSSIWQSEDQLLFPQTPPNILVEQKNYTQNVFYELFPAEKRGFEFKTPVTSMSPSSNYTGSAASPKYSPSLSSTPPTSMNQMRLPTSPFRFPSQPNFGSGSSRYQDARGSKMCTFCRKNGETPLVYMTHAVKEKIGNQNVVTCPILRSHVCSTCGASGDNAHTITYCPILRSNNNGQPLQSTTITLKNTRIKSNGRRRY